MCHSKLLKLDSEKKGWVACVYYWPFTLQMLIYFQLDINPQTITSCCSHWPQIHVLPFTAVLCIMMINLKLLFSCNKSQMDTAILCFHKRIRIKWNDSHIIRRFAKKLRHMMHLTQQYLLLVHLEKGNKTISVLPIKLERCCFQTQSSVYSYLKALKQVHW